MSVKAARLRNRRAGARAFAGTMLFTLVLLFAVYHMTRTISLSVGSLGDGPFLTGFYPDELDLTYRYRWTTAEASIRFPGAGSAAPELLSVRAQDVQELDGSQGANLSVESGEAHWVPDGVTSLAGGLNSYVYRAPEQPLADAREVQLKSSTYRPPGESRDLGLKVASVTLAQRGDGFNLPPLDVIVWSLLAVVGVFGIFSRLRRYIAPVAGASAALVLAGAVAVSPIYVSAYLPPLAALLGLAGLAVWQRERLPRWPEAIDRLGQSTRATSALMLGAMLLYMVVCIAVALQSDWIGHADYAENAVVARNFREGRGLVVDYVAQFYNEHPGITHAAETWPLLQPLMIAPFFTLFGPETWAAKLPNIFVMLALAWMVYALSSKLWDRRVGLVAGLLTLLHPYFFNSAIYPINDLPFTALFFGLAWLAWRQVSPKSLLPDRDAPIAIVDNVPTGHDRFALARRSPLIGPALAGALAGLLIWSKPSGAVLVVGLVVWAGWTWLRYEQGKGRRLPWRAIMVAGGAMGIVLAPLVVRNLLAFGQLYFTTESLDAPILRYWPLRAWENIYALYPPDDLPHPRWVIGGKYGYQNLWDAFVLNLRWVWERGIFTEPAEGDHILGLFPLLLAGLGLAGLTRRTASLFSMVALAVGIYSAFVLTYWHFEGRYFQVVVPWLLMLAAWGLFWLWDRLRERLREGTGRRWGLVLLPIALLPLILPNLGVILDQVEREVQPTGFAATMRWLQSNSTPDDVVMTRDPWELNWYTRRRAVMIPFGDLQTIQSTARKYRVTLLQLGGPVDRVNIADCPAEPSAGARYPTGSRPALGQLYCGYEMPGFRLVYKDRGGTIYRLDP